MCTTSFDHYIFDIIGPTHLVLLDIKSPGFVKEMSLTSMVGLRLLSVMFLLSSKTRWVGPYHFVLNENFPNGFSCTYLFLVLYVELLYQYILLLTAAEIVLSTYSARERLFSTTIALPLFLVFFWEVAQTDNSVWSFGRPGDRYMGRKYSP